MILTTTNTIEHHKIADYLGIITGVSFKTRDVVKGFKIKNEDYFSAFEKVLEELKEEAFQKMKTSAKSAGANDIVGIHVDFEPIGGDLTRMLGVSVIGTAVKVALP